MKALAHVILIMLMAPLLPGGEHQPSRFEHLDDALQLLDSAVSSGDRGLLAAALAIGDGGYFAKHPEVFDMLRAQRAEGGALRALYKGREFPKDGDTFKLGGHASELGHIHIDFVRRKTGWFLKDIWNCR